MSREFKSESDRIVRTALGGNVEDANRALRQAIAGASSPPRLNYKTIAIAVALICIVFVGVDLLDGRLIDI